MTLLDVEMLARYWHRHPPVHLLVAGFVGYKADDVVAVQAVAPVPPASAKAALAALPGLSAAISDDLPAPVFDIAELMAMRPN